MYRTHSPVIRRKERCKEPGCREVEKDHFQARETEKVSRRTQHRCQGTSRGPVPPRLCDTVGICGIQLEEKDSDQNGQRKENSNASAAKKRAPPSH